MLYAIPQRHIYHGMLGSSSIMILREIYIKWVIGIDTLGHTKVGRSGVTVALEHIDLLITLALVCLVRGTRGTHRTLDGPVGT